MDFPDFSDIPVDPIQFYAESLDFQLANESEIIAWITQTIIEESKKLVMLNFIFCNDEYLHKINVEYLDHDTLTDIITFPYSDDEQFIEGDIYISVQRVRANAQQFNVPFLQELHRVIIHGVLHLCGYGDKTETEKKVMRSKEDFYITKVSSSSSKQ
ncbi:MAG: rRNA maturation RNase YbeY [Bacteroidota bacterium]